MNQVTLIGNLTHDLELKKSTENATPYTHFRLAVNRNDSKTNEADFFDIVAFNKKAEILSQHTGKGQKLLVIGSLQNNTYTTSSGEKRTRTKVILDNFEFVGSKKA